MSDSEGRRGRFTPLKRLSDDELAVEAARGEDKAFALLFERLQDPLYRYSMSILGNPEEARDALQNTMLKAYRALRGETREIAVRPWMYRIARNESISTLRGRRPLGELEEAVGVAAAGADVDAASRERLADLVSDLRSLPERQRSALVLRELSGLDYEELGTALDISPNAARQTVFKARVAMQANGEGRTAHCDEVRAAMSKADGRFRRRRSIQAHLDRCAVCTEFAEGLERRPRDLAVLFPPLPAGVAAAVLAGVTGGAAAAAGGAADAGVAGAGAGAGAAGAGGAGEAGKAAAATPKPTPARRGERRRRAALVPLLLFLLLIGGTVAMALLVADGDDGGDSGSDVARQTGGAGGETDTGDSGGGAGGDDDSGEKPSGPGEEKPSGSGEEKDSGSDSREKPSGESRERERDGSGEGSGSGSGGSEGGGGVDCVRRTRADTSPAQEGYSGRGGRIEVEVTEDCVPTRGANDVRRGSDGLPITGLELGLILGTALLLMGLGVGLRRLATR